MVKYGLFVCACVYVYVCACVCACVYGSVLGPISFFESRLAMQCEGDRFGKGRKGGRGEPR